jgi:hypothetical protein
MEKYDRCQRRALNIIWAAAEDYHYEPDFLALQADGQPDLYLNTILGLAAKQYDTTKLRAFFQSLAGSALAETFTDIAWLGLENCTCQKALPCRPALISLRQAHADAFFQRNTDLAMQQLMDRNHLTHDLQAARWHEVRGERSGLLNPWEKRLYAALAYEASLDTQQIITRTQTLLHDFFILDFKGRRSSLHHYFSLPEKLAAQLKRFLPVELRYQDDKLTRIKPSRPQPPTEKNLIAQTLQPLLASMGLHNAKDNQAYIKQHFGPSLYSPLQNARLEKTLCTGNHQNCHLHFTRGPAAAVSRTASISPGTAAPPQDNLAWFQQHRQLYRLNIRQLADRLRNCLAVHQQPIPVLDRQGRFSARQVWRALHLHDGRVFQDQQEEIQPDFTVDLMLDASASRASHQSIIAAQAYTIAESLRLCGIPLQVWSFCSLRGYTILHIFQGYQETDRTQNIFSYAAAGWNRDGLALRAAAELMQLGHPRKRLLIMLTDVYPHDDQRIPAAGSLPLAYDYAGQRAIDDTAAEAGRLRAAGVHIIGLLNGELPGFLAAAHQIYGSDFARIPKIDQLAATVGQLIQKQIQSF